MNAAKTIRAIRKALKISRMELANRTGYSLWAITSYEQGKRNPGPRFVEKLEEVRHGGRARGAARAADLKAVNTLLLSVEDRVRALESRFAALEVKIKQASAERRGEAGGVRVRGAVQVGGQEQASGG